VFRRDVSLPINPSPPNVLGLSCASNMPPLGREVQAERHSILQAYRDSSKPVLDGASVQRRKVMSCDFQHLVLVVSPCS